MIILSLALAARLGPVKGCPSAEKVMWTNVAFQLVRRRPLAELIRWRPLGFRSLVLDSQVVL